MSKELRALLAKLEQRKTEVRTFIAQDNAKEADELMNEVRSLQAQVKVLQELENEERDGLDGGTPAGGQFDSLETREEAQLEQEYTGIFLRGLRRQGVTADMRSIVKEYQRRAVMNEGETSPAIPEGNSTLIVPKDIQTRIHTFMRTLNDLSELVNVITVSALSGSRVMESDQTMIPFPVIEEYGAIPESDNPKFSNIDYKVRKRGGILPITNELLADTDQNLLAHIIDWLGRKAVVTKNTMIINQLQTLPKQQWGSFGDIKHALNVGLDPMISQQAVILTNQDGYNWLDQLVDTQGRPLLQPDITAPGKYVFKGRRIEVASNRFLPSDTVNAKAPMVVGNLKQLIAMFSRKFFELASTTEGGDAWRRDTTELRALMRDDIKTWDAAAAVYGELDISDTV
ncbi:phage major capsid protein [Paenibacillus sp. 598K]|uniref:phage major capsid protein n=1 Tax=Paenibacillus sp. 598K TaxID=1117987 RepID=UPI000FFA81E7|nr:phage major capsid protein [Paenibacillus sp. 598K]GBF73061.1 phage major capsid protein [Paenibacillus sp. 598K]